MKICLLFNQPEATSSAADQDVLVQVETVRQSLIRLGHEPIELGCTLDLSSTRQRLIEIAPDLVFNLVESLGGIDRLMPLATLLLDSLGLPYTGTHTEAMLLANDKIRAKAKMQELGIPTPDWICDSQSPAVGDRVLHDEDATRNGDQEPMIVKAIWEHASWGMDDQAIVPSRSLARQRMREKSAVTGRPHFAEAFIDGREFNLSVLSAPVRPPRSTISAGNRPVVLPAAEIDFSGLSPHKPRIVGHAAKWEEGSEEYQQTPRRFLESHQETRLVAQLNDIAARCWDAFALCGYARVDFRVDFLGSPYVLEINANPCLSPDAGFAAALERAGISFDEAVARIVQDSLRFTSHS